MLDQFLHPSDEDPLGRILLDSKNCGPRGDHVNSPRKLDDANGHSKRGVPIAACFEP